MPSESTMNLAWRFVLLQSSSSSGRGWFNRTDHGVSIDYDCADLSLAGKLGHRLDPHSLALFVSIVDFHLNVMGAEPLKVS